MAKQKMAKGPQFVKYFGPVIEALKELGGSGRPTEVKDWIADRLSISDEEQNELLKSGESRYSNQVAWARFYLVKAGYLDSSTRGVWSLTEKGRQASLTHQQALTIFREVQEQVKAVEDQTGETAEESQDEDAPEFPPSEDEDHRATLVNMLQSLPAEGFERLCQRLLRESGFERVRVTGRSGDGGIDGIGVLQINSFVSFKALFQCKRYSGSVGAPQVRDFRGAMMGRADKGIILTTGTFTGNAKREAVRDGVPQIELVDGEKLLDLFEDLEFGLNPKTVYEVDVEFFDEFR
jgi:restriction system protein